MLQKDRQLFNQKLMIESRDILIRDMQEQTNTLYEENKELRFENQQLKDCLSQIEKIMKEI